MVLSSKIFNNENHKLEDKIYSFAKGELIDITKVPDPIFSQKKIGDGFAIIPSDGEIFSPISGEVVQIFPTKHTVGIKSYNGLEILIHIGLDTVKMNGDGFKTHIQTGDFVSVGDKLISFSLDLLKEKSVSTIIPCVITKMDKIENFELLNKTNVKQKEEIAIVKLK